MPLSFRDPGTLCRIMWPPIIENGVSADHEVEVWEKLTQHEAEWRGALGAVKETFSDMSIMLIRALVPFKTGLEFIEGAVSGVSHG